MRTGALVGGAGGGRSSGGGGQQPSQERIFLAHGLVGDDGDLTVAGRGDEGDDPATLEEAEDALAGALDDLARHRAAWARARVEHLALAVAVWRVDTVEKQAVKVRVAPEVAGGAMNGGDRAALAARKSAVSLALAIPPRHGVGEDAQDLAQQCAVERERTVMSPRLGKLRYGPRPWARHSRTVDGGVERSMRLCGIWTRRRASSFIASLPFA
jgi:hypothetical protein